MHLAPKTILRMISYWPPYLAGGIKVVEVAEDLSRVTVRLKTRPWNRNYFGTHFGGSLYAMCDPFFVFLLIHQLGPDHIVWDKAAEVEFLKAVSEPVYATFSISPEEADAVRRTAVEQFSVEPVFRADIVTADHTIVARVTKTLYVRRKDAKERFPKRSTA